MPMRDNGSLVGFVTILRDRTEARLAEEKLRAQAEQLRDADQRKDEFIAVLAHELRNPLAPIRTGLELLRLRGDQPGTLERVAPVLERQINHMVRLIDDLLDVSRITSGRIHLDRRPTPVTELVQVAVEANRAAIDTARLSLTVGMPEGRCLVDVDPTRFAQVLSNLLHNATKFTEPGGRIAICASVDDHSEAPQLTLTVRDTGVGIPAHLLPHVFDLFVQGTGETTRKSGLGIGLALARQLIEMHGGRIDAESEGPGRGSTFTVRMPVVASQMASPTPERPNARVTISLRVLIVDDNTDAADTLSALVAALGGDARTACDGAAGLRQAADFRPDVVLLDIGMPGMDGFETCRRLRAEPYGKDAYIVALTGWGQEQDRARSLSSGFDAHLTKPADPRQLESLLFFVGSERGSSALNPVGSIELRSRMRSR